MGTCKCTTPGRGTAGFNQLTCTNGETRHCSATQECYATSPFTYGSWSAGCRAPVAKKTPVGNWLLYKKCTYCSENNGTWTYGSNDKTAPQNFAQCKARCDKEGTPFLTWRQPATRKLCR